MDLYPLNIRGEEFEVAVADNDDLRYKGLSSLERLGPRKGMLFAWPDPVQPEMVMRDMKFDLDFLFLDKDFGIIKLGSISKNSAESISPDVPVNFVLELPAGTLQRLNLDRESKIMPSEKLKSGLDKGVQRFKDGGTFEMVGEKSYKIKESDLKADPSKLQILDKDGIVVANIDPGSRIFSRIHTKELINKYKSGDKLALAKFMIEVLDIQDKQDADYVKK